MVEYIKKLTLGLRYRSPWVNTIKDIGCNFVGIRLQMMQFEFKEPVFG